MYGGTHKRFWRYTQVLERGHARQPHSSTPPSRVTAVGSQPIELSSCQTLPLNEILGHEIRVEMILPTGPLELTRPIFIVMLRGDPYLTLTQRLRGHIG